MGRILVVSSNPGLAMGLESTDHAVTEIPPSELEHWMEGPQANGLDGLVLDLADSAAAIEAITGLRARAHMIPVLIVPGDGSGWDDQRMQELPAAALVARPVTRGGLQEAVDRLVDEGTGSFLSSRVPRPDAESDQTPIPQVMPLERRRSEGGHGAPTGSPGGADEAVATGEDITALFDRLTAAPSVLATAFEPVVAPESVVRDERNRTPAELVRELRGVAHHLYGVSETADVVIDDALQRTKAEAAALLLPDGPRWRVAGGIGLRPLERRYELTPEDWLIVQVARGHRALVMEDTDVVRQPLRGSPLASWHHLLAAPVPEVDGVILVARAVERPSFAEDDVESLSLLAHEAAPLLEAALDVRALARRLAALRDAPPARLD